MLDVSRDIHSVNDFKKNTSELINQLKETGEPVFLTIDGRPELVVQDAASYQRLIELAEEAQELHRTQQAVAEMKAGLGRPAANMLADMRRAINEKQGSALPRRRHPDR
jgi:prevent-host-death family protein